MPRTSDINKQIKDERKQSILVASIPLFALYNEKVSVDMICEKAKCSHGLLYHYFRDANNVLFNIRKTDTYLNLKAELLSIVDNDSAIDSVYQIVRHVNDCVEKAKNEDYGLLYLVINEEEKTSFKNTLIGYVKKGQIQNQIVAGKPENIVSIFINQINGVLLKKLLQKSYKVEVPPVDNIMQIFIKKTVR